jgi:4-amino-4-deoxy-L-arabinose transferase-like glycosyltransferase
MKARWLPWVVVAAVSALILSGALMSRPPLSDREEQLAALAGSLAFGGATWSLLVHAGGEIWFQPLEIYPTAVLLKTGLTPAAALRLPSAFAGVLTALLTAMLAMRVSGTRAAALAPVLLLLVPAFLAHTRSGGGELMMVPPILTWFVVVLEHRARPRGWLPIAGGAALAVSLYTQPAGVLAVPVYLLIGSVALLGGGRGWRPVAEAAGAIALCALPLAVVFVRDQAVYPDTFGRWAVHLAHVRNPWDGLIAFTRWDVMGRRAGAYWGYFSPGLLFLSGQMFTPIFGVLIPFGIWAVESQATVARRLIIAGLLAAPVAPVLLDIPRSPGLVLPLAVFGVYLAALGIEALVAAAVHVLNDARSVHERA